ncbi:MAG: hypothetical protein H8D61_01260 [Deltaproteobacteria bacterium]|nr:hypothetical protein [Deltaproteobacteria bacterium]
MLDNDQRRYVYRYARIPEHLPDYVAAVSGAKPYLHENCLCFVQRQHLVIIGYSLGGGLPDLPQIYQSVCDRFRPASTAIIAPQMWLAENSCEHQPRDDYYRLTLPLHQPASPLAYMIRRARKEVQVSEGRFGREHKKMIKEFIATHSLAPAQRKIYKQIPQYLKTSKTALLLEARQKDALCAFTIMDLGSAEYAFYLFNLRSATRYVPGASDILFFEMVKRAQNSGKKAVNLGLGINEGIRRFKKKWGGTPFLPYFAALVRQQGLDMGRLEHKL